MKLLYPKVLAIPAVELIVIILVLILSVSSGSAYLKSRQIALNDARKNENILLQKRDILTGLGNDVLSQTSLVAVSLPDKNPAFSLLSQVRQIASENSIALSGFAMDKEGQDAGNLSTIGFSFVAEGNIGSIINFVKAVHNILPLSETTGVKMEIDGAMARAVIELKSYWSPLPKNITSFGGKLTDLTGEDKNVLSKLSEYKFPSIVITQASPPLQNTNPFGE